MQKIIPYGKQTINKDDIQAVIQVLKSDYLTQGPAIKKFEESVAQYCNVKYAVAFSSGTAALHGACFAAQIAQNDEVITTPLTFVASANCVLYCGGIPKFADIKVNSPLIDPKEIVSKITKKTRAIIPVDYSGMPADYDEINVIARKHNLIVIADAAHSLGATYKGRKVGSLADMTVFSFHPVKTITTGEGGMVVTDNKKLYERLILFRTHGITKNKSLLKEKNIGPWFYEMQELGFNYRMTDMQAALGKSQMQKIDTFLAKRQKIATLYQQQLHNQLDMGYIILPEDRTSSWHLFPLRVSAKKRKNIVKWLHKQGILVQVHYIPITNQPYYQKNFGYTAGLFPNTQAYYAGVMSLPIFPTLRKTDINYVLKQLFLAVQKYT